MPRLFWTWNNKVLLPFWSKDWLVISDSIHHHYLRLGCLFKTLEVTKASLDGTHTRIEQLVGIVLLPIAKAWFALSNRL